MVLQDHIDPGIKLAILVSSYFDQTSVTVFQNAG